MSEPIIFENVEIGKNVEIEPFCVIGKPARGKKPGEVKTVIGDNATIRSHSVIYAGNTIGDGFNTGHHVVIREDNKIGDNVSIGSNSVIEHHVTIENKVRCHSNVFVPEFSILKEGSWLGPNTVLTNAKFPLSDHVKDELEGPIIEEGAIVGANSTILPGVRIGSGALIGAGSVVTKDVASETINVGNPSNSRGSIKKSLYSKRDS